MCGIYYFTCMCKSHLHLVSFLFHLLVSSLFVLSDVLVEDIVGVHMYMYIQKGNGVLFNWFCCGIYEELSNYDNVVSCIKTLSRCRVPCVSVPPILSYINLNCWRNGLKCGVTVFCGVLWSKK